ncbi:MAG: ParA family partition ATPase [Gammaproteobacteria bacterium]|nr:ParA family partition ATPase [Gammaproteobacteria bacterium]
MPVIALIGNKGGAGKTTLCVNLAAALGTESPTVILDADPQQSSLQWQNMADDPQAVNVLAAGDDVHQAYSALADESYVNCLIDCPPSAQSKQMHDALTIADLAVVPVLPSPLDIWATVHIEQAVEQARQVNPELKVVLVINQFESRTRLSRLMERALAQLELPASKAFIKRRAIYRHSLLEGRTVHDVGARGKAASEEIHQLIKDIEEYL